MGFCEEYCKYWIQDRCKATPELLIGSCPTYQEILWRAREDDMLNIILIEKEREDNER